MAIVTVEELVDFMSGVDLTPQQVDAAESVLAGVQAQLEENHLGRPVERLERTESVAVSAQGELQLSATPVVSISAATVNGTAVDTYLHEERGWTTGGLGWYWGWPGGPELVTVTYVGGIDGANRPDLKLAIMKVASRIVQNMHDDTRGVRDLDAEDVSPLPDHWTDEDLAPLSRSRRFTVV